jgi:hypothetical protein
MGHLTKKNERSLLKTNVYFLLHADRYVKLSGGVGVLPIIRLPIGRQLPPLLKTGKRARLPQRDGGGPLKRPG